MATTTTSPAASPRFRLRLPEAVSVLGERDFRVIWIGQTISMVGTWMQFVAQGLLVLKLWDSAFALGALNFANAIPSLIVLLFGGVLADRADKRLILLLTQSVMLLLAAAIGVLIVTDHVQYWMLIVATVALGLAFGYDLPAASALMPELVPPEKIGQVVALNSSMFHGTRMVGPAIAGILIGAFGLGTAYFLNAASFLAVILSLLIIRYRPAPWIGGRSASAIEGLKAGLRHVGGRPNLQALLLLTALNCIFVFPVAAILVPFYVKDVLHAGPGVLGLMFMAGGLGSMLGAMALIWWSGQRRVERIWLGFVVAPVGLTIQALTREPAVAILVQGFVSFAFSSQMGLILTMIQESTPGEFRGRVMSLHGITFNSTMPLAAIGISAAAAVFGLPAVMVALSGAFALTGAWALGFAGGGITHVVRASHAEYAHISADAPGGHRP
jgi:MFS family permease